MAWRRIDRPLALLTAALDRASVGDLTTVLAVRRDDELGKLADHFNAMTGVMTDARRQDQDASRASELRYRSLFENMLAGFAYCRMLFEGDRPVDCEIVEVNRMFETLTGLKDPAGRKVSDMFPGIQATNPEMFVAYGRVATTGVPEQFELYVPGLETWFSVSAYCPEPGYFVSVFDDITERKLAENRVIAADAKYRSLVEHAVYGIYTSTSAGRFTSVNRALVEMLGCANPDEAMALDMTRDLYVDPLERAALVARYADARRIEGVEVRWKRRNGEPFTARLSGVPAHAVDGSLDGFEMVVEDVTRRHVLESQLRQAQKMEAVGRLAGGVAHDFNNLLSVIMTYTELLLMDLEATDPQRHDLESIRQAASTGAALTRQLLAFSRQQVLEPRVLTLNEVVRGAERILRPLIGEDVTLVTTLERDAGRVRADAGQIEQVIMNLAVNARDAMPEGGTLTIETSSLELMEEYASENFQAKPGRYVVLSVSDTGIGMDEQTRARVFEPFFTTKEAGRGTGLGLATVYGVVKQSGGYIWVHSTPGQGTVFRIYLPRVDEVAEPGEPAATAGPEGGTETILLVEDAAALRLASRRVLERRGYTVLDAPDGQTALSLAAGHEGPIQLLLTDVVMPGIGGRQLADRLRELRADLKVVFMSGYTDDEIMRRGVFERGGAFLQKPFATHDLSRKVREVLDTPHRA